jgi:hypothetical protein
MNKVPEKPTPPDIELRNEGWTLDISLLLPIIVGLIFLWYVLSY